jgi:hypothetical protein
LTTPPPPPPVPTTSTTPTPPSVAPPPPTPTIRHQDVLSLGVDFVLDLDAPPTDSAWVGRFPLRELSWDGANLQLGNGVKAVDIGTVPAGYDVCRARTDYLPQSASPLANAQFSDYICVLTDELRYAWVNLIDIDPNTGALIIKIESYDPPEAG